MEIRYYDRQGRGITLADSVRLQTSDLQYFRVAETTLPDGTWISTVWLGINHNYHGGAPLIFETMAFPSRDNLSETDCDRYATEAEAVAGHARMVAKWTAKLEATHDARQL